MIYKPSAGRFKDTVVFWHEGTYHLFAMHTPGPDDGFRDVWMATSADGVHWEDVGPVIENAPFMVWAMAVHRVGDRFLMNHGSFTTPGVQNVLRFWESSDLRHWTYLGPEADVTPDPRWYPPESRLDCMNVIAFSEDGSTRYYGYATGPGGFLVSDDGLRWSGRPPGQIVWGPVPPPPPTNEGDGQLEIGGCLHAGGRFYRVGGWFNYLGRTGYGTYTLVGEAPTGPFRPDPTAYRLTGHSQRWVSLWARFCPTPSCVLVNGYMYSGHSYETGEAWLPPLKRAVVDAEGHLRLGYWDGNEQLKGAPVEVDLTQGHPVYPAPLAEGCTYEVRGETLALTAGPERASFDRTGLVTTIAVLDQPLDADRGVILEGQVEATCRNRTLVAPSVGFYLEEEPGSGTAVLLHGYGSTEIGRLRLSPDLTFEVEDVIGPGCAAPAGIAPHTPSTFRLLLRRNMFELYLDDLLVQSFNTSHDPGSVGPPPRHLGFLVQNGQGYFRGLRMWTMSLEA